MAHHDCLFAPKLLLTYLLTYFLTSFWRKMRHSSSKPTQAPALRNPSFASGRHNN